MPHRRAQADIIDSCKHQFTIESFGVKVRIGCNSASGLRELHELVSSALGGKYKLLDGANAEHTFTHIRKKDGNDDLYKDGKLIAEERIRESVLRQFPSDLRITVAEFAKRKVFVHAGAVSWKGQGIILPANSGLGKSTLTAELIKLGAKYFSDEYAVLDEQSRIHPLPKPLSLVRGVETIKSEFKAEEFGAAPAKRPVPVKLVVLAEYKPNVKWKTQILSTGQSVLEIIRSAVPTRRFPEFTLSVLNLVARQATVVRSRRGEAADTAGRIIELIESLDL
jgi:hypothetical protein